MKYWISALIVLILVACGDEPVPDPIPTKTRPPAFSPEPTPTSTPPPTFSPEPTPTSTPPPTFTPEPTPASTPPPTFTPEPTPTSTPPPTFSPEPTPTSTRPPTFSPAPDGAAESGGLFSEVDGVVPASTDLVTLAGRLARVDFGQLHQAIESSNSLVLNLFDDALFTGIVEDVQSTSAGHALSGKLEDVGLGTFTLVANGSVLSGTVRTPKAVFTIRTLGDGKYVIRQVDESSLPPMGEPLRDSDSPRGHHP